MDEDVFLKSRQERELARAAKQSCEDSDDAIASKAFHSQCGVIAAQITDYIAQSKVDEAHKAWKDLQLLIQSAATTIRLTPHELKNANAKLNELLGAVDALRSAAKPVKKFTFSSRSTAEKKTSPPPDPTQIPVAVVSPATSDGGEVPSGGVLYKARLDETIRIPPGRAVFIRECSRCVIYVLPVEGSLFLSDCSDCTVYGACFQLRVKSSHRMRFYVTTMSTPVIESSDGISFGSYKSWRGLESTPTAPYFSTSAVVSGDTPRFASHAAWLTEVGRFSNAEQQLRESFKKVDDFHWLRQQQSPNWSVEAPEHYAVSDEVFTEPSNPNEK
jgi:hypothetical protein